MSAVSLRPVLRPSTLPSLPFSSTNTSSSTTYICQSCRHARLLRRPKRPYTFTQLVTMSDGSAFTMRTTSPMPVYRSTRDTRNVPLWNPSSKELLNVEDDEAGRLAGFRARFGKGFDAQREAAVGTDSAGEDGTQETGSGGKSGSLPAEGAQQGAFFKPATETKHSKGAQPTFDEEYYEFEEDDSNLLDLISSYGKEVNGPKAAPPPPAASSKKGKK